MGKLGLCVGLLCALVSGPARANKSPFVAGVLGGGVGFGAGQFYSGGGEGMYFTAADAVLLGGLLYFSAPRRDVNILIDPATGDYEPLSWGIGSVLLLVRGVEAGLAMEEAKWHNGQTAPKRRGAPHLALEFTNSALGDFSGSRINQLFSAGRDGRDRALAMSRWQAGQTGLRVNVGVADPGVGVCWSTSF